MINHCEFSDKIVYVVFPVPSFVWRGVHENQLNNVMSNEVTLYLFAV